MKFSLKSLMRFSIRDMLLITVVAAAVVWSVNREMEYRAMQKEVNRLRHLYYEPLGPDPSAPKQPKNSVLNLTQTRLILPHEPTGFQLGKCQKWQKVEKPDKTRRLFKFGN